MMDWMKYIGVAMQVVTALLEGKASIDASQSFQTPPVNTYIDGKHGQITVTWNPLT